MENIPYNGAQEEDQDLYLFDGFEKEEKVEDDDEETNKKKKKKAQSYFKDLFKKFFLVSKEDKEEESSRNPIITPFVSYNEVIELPSLVLAEEPLFNEETASVAEPVQETEPENVANTEVDHHDERLVLVNEESNGDRLKRTNYANEEPIDFRNKIENKQIDSVKGNKENHRTKNKTETIAEAMVRHIAKKKIKGLESEVVKVQKKIAQLEKEKQKKPEPIRPKIKSKEPKDHTLFKKEFIPVKKPEAVVEKKSESSDKGYKITEKNNITPEEDKTTDLSRIRKRLEKQYIMAEKNTEQNILQIKKEIMRKEKEYRFDIEELNNAVNPEIHSATKNTTKIVPINAGITVSQEGGHQEMKTPKLKKTDFIQSQMPQNYKQAVKFGVSYGVIIVFVLLLLIVLRLI